MSASESVLEARILDLESRCRRLSLGLKGLGAGMLAACLAAAVSSTPDEVRARDFILVGPDGRERGHLAADESGSGLWLWDAKGTARMTLTTEQRELMPSLLDTAAEGEVREVEDQDQKIMGPWAGIEMTTAESSVMIASMPEGTMIHLEGGDESYGVANLFATGVAGSGLDVSWNDERGVRVSADDEESRLQMSTDVGGAWEEGEEPVREKPILELTATGEAGSIRLHDGDEVTFESP